MTTKLPELLKTHDHFGHELAKMDADAARAKETETRILEDGKVTDTEVAALTTARTTRELIARRRPTIVEALGRVEDQLRVEVQAAAQRFNRVARTAREALEEQIIEANRQWWNGNARGLKKWVATGSIPAVYELGRASFNCGFANHPEPGFWAIQARLFITHSARQAKAFNLTLD